MKRIPVAVTASVLALAGASACKQQPPQPQTPTMGTEERPIGETELGYGEPMAVITFVEYSMDPGRFIGSQVSAEARVDEVISDRAFWLDAGEHGRVLAVVREDVPRPQRIDIDAGQRIQFTGQVMSPARMKELGGTLEDDTIEAIRSQPAFLSLRWNDVTMVGPESP